MLVASVVGCGRESPYRVVEVQGEDEWWGLSPYGLVISGAEEGASTYLLVEDGDLLGWGMLPVLPADTGTLVVDGSEDRVGLGGRTVFLELQDDGVEAWAWLEQATPEELADLRFISVRRSSAPPPPGSLTPDSTEGKLPPDRVVILEHLAAANPVVSLAGESEDVLRQLLEIFDPVFVLTDSEYGTPLKEALAGEPNLRTLLTSGDEVDSVGFLRQLGALQRLILGEWSPEDNGPLPDSLPSLRSVSILGTSMETLDALGIQPRLEELTVFGCETEDEAPVDIDALARYPRLEKVSLRDCPVSEDLSPLDRLGRLRWLALPPGTTQEQMEHIVRTHPGLRVLETVGAEGITDLSPLAALTELEALFVGRSAPTDPLYHMDHLKYLAVFVEDDELPAFREDVLPRLQAELPETAIARLEGFCLGSGFILLLFPWVIGAWWIIRGRRGRESAISHA
jgi:hypothetical protein